MKVFAYIFTIYMLALNFVPCNDTFVVQEQENHSISLQLEQDSHEHGTIDCCTPFCQCNCCQVHIVDFGPGILSLYNIREFDLHQFIHFDNLGKEFPTSILQPPQA